MALINFWSQKNYINGLQADLSGLTAYANALNSCAAELNACWDGNSDKQYVISAIGRQMQAVNSLRQEVNWVRQTSDFVLVKLNELGALTGFSQPYVAQVASIGMMISCSAQTRIRLNTGTVRATAMLLNNRRSSLAGSKGNLFKARNIIDVFILGIWGIGGRLNGINSKMDELIARHDRIVKALNQIADRYDTADRRLAIKAGGGSNSFGYANGGGIRNSKTTSGGSRSAIKNILDWLGSGANVYGKVMGNADASLGGSMFKYFNSLFSFYSGSKQGFDGYQDLLGFGKASTGAFEAIYKYIEKSLGPYLGSGFSQKFGGLVSGVSMYGSSVGFSKSFLATYASIKNGESGAKITADVIGTIGSAVQFGGKSWLFYNFTPKVSGLVMSKSGALSTGLKVNPKIGSALIYLNIVDAGFSFLSTGAGSVDKYSVDGKFDWTKIGHVGAESSISGLNKLTGGFFSDESVSRASTAVIDFSENWGHSAYDKIRQNEYLSDMYDAGGIKKFSAKIIGINVVSTEWAVNGWTKLFGK